MRQLFLAVTILWTGAARATEWQALGPRAMGMGGAGVAMPQGGESAYWNPATLGLADNLSGLQVPVGAHLGVTGTVLQGANDLNQVVKDCQSGSAACTNANIQNALNEMNDPNNGVRGDVAGGANLKIGRLALFANSLTWVGGKPRMDLVNNTTAGPTSVNNNTSSLLLSGVSVTEFGVGYGRELSFAPGLHAGVALKGMVGRVGFQNVSVVATDPGSGALDQFKKTSKTSFQPGVDLGLLWDVDRTFSGAWWKPRIGITARNINNPRFKNTDAAILAGQPSKYSVQGNTRMGVAISPLHFWNIAADADITNNITAVEGVKSRQVGLGTEINVFNRSWINIPLRAGLSKNIAQAGSKMGLAGGVGLNFLHVNVDIGCQVTPSNQTVQTQGQTKKMPSDVSVAAQFALLFGGASETKAD